MFGNFGSHRVPCSEKHSPKNAKEKISQNFKKVPAHGPRGGNNQTLKEVCELC